MKRESRPYKIINHRVLDQEEHRLSYLCKMEGQGAEEKWIDDTQLVGEHRLIHKYYQRGCQKYDSIDQEDSSPLEPQKKGKKAALNKKKVKKESWHIPNTNKLEQRKIKELQKETTRQKRKAKKYQREDLGLLRDKINQLTAYINKPRPDCEKLDYLLNSVEGVFEKEGRSYFIVKTLPPKRNYIVTMTDMERYFPMILREHLRMVFRLHSRNVDYDAIQSESSLEGFEKFNQQQQQQYLVYEEDQEEDNSNIKVERRN